MVRQLKILLVLSFCVQSYNRNIKIKVVTVDIWLMKHTAKIFIYRSYQVEENKINWTSTCISKSADTINNLLISFIKSGLENNRLI